MKLFSSNQFFFSIINIFLILFISIDAYLLPPTIIKDQFDYTDIRTVHGRSTSYEVQEINTVSGIKITGPEHFYLPLVKGCDLFILKTGLLHRNLYLEFSDKDYNYKVPIGLLNDTDRGLLYKILFIACFLISMNYIIPKPIIRLNDSFLPLISIVLYIVSTIIYLLFY